MYKQRIEYSTHGVCCQTRVGEAMDFELSNFFYEVVR